MMATTVEAVALRGVRFRLWTWAPFRRGPFRQWGIAIVKNVTQQGGEG